MSKIIHFLGKIWSNYSKKGKSKKFVFCENPTPPFDNSCRVLPAREALFIKILDIWNLFMGPIPIWGSYNPGLPQGGLGPSFKTNPNRGAPIAKQANNAGGQNFPTSFVLITSPKWIFSEISGNFFFRYGFAMKKNFFAMEILFSLWFSLARTHTHIDENWRETRKLNQVIFCW